MKYSIEITSGNENVASAYGSVELASYAAKTVEFDAETDYTVRLQKIDETTGEPATVANLTADGDTVSTVLKSKLSRERKAARAGAEPASGESEDSPVTAGE